MLFFKNIAIGRKPPVGDTKVRVPKFRLPTGATNFLRTSSMKITETGAKDLLNSQPINKVCKLYSNYVYTVLFIDIYNKLLMLMKVIQIASAKIF